MAYDINIMNKKILLSRFVHDLVLAQLYPTLKKGVLFRTFKNVSVCLSIGKQPEYSTHIPYYPKFLVVPRV